MNLALLFASAANDMTRDAVESRVARFLCGTCCATTTGVFRVLPAHAEMMYAPEVSGRTDGGVFEIK